MKKIQYTVIITFAAILAAFCFCSLFTDSDGFSPFENRYLAARPDFSVKEFFAGDFTDDYETFLLDNFMLRDLSIKGYQSYSNILFLDAFSEGETVLASVDIDTFVTAGGQEGFSGSEADDASFADQVNAGGELLQSSDPGPDAAADQFDAGTQVSGGSDSDENGVNGASQIGSTQDSDGGLGISGSGQTNIGQQSQTGEAVDGQALQAGSYASAASGQNQGQEAGQSSGQSREQGTGQSSGQQQGGTESAAGTSVKEQADTKLNNSLIISGDRIMMPTGSSGNLAHFGEIMAEFARIMPEVNVYSITGPTSAAFYASKKYSTGGYDQSKAEKIISGSAEGVTIVKTYDKLKEHKDEYIYFRSDVHWSALGAYYAYAAFCESAGMEAADLVNDFTKYTYEPFLGGLYSQIYKTPQAARLNNNPEQLDYYIPKLGHNVTLYTMGNIKTPRNAGSIINTDFKSLGAYKYSCFAWGDQRLEKITTDNPNGREVLVIKDSYGSALIPFLVHNYSLIYVIDPKGFNSEGSLDFDAKTLITDEKIDDVIFCFSIYGSARKIIRDSLTSLLLK
jgi:hypothetical protein